MTVTKYLDVRYTPPVREQFFHVKVEVPDDFSDDQILNGVEKLIKLDEIPGSTFLSRNGKLRMYFLTSEDSETPTLTLALEPKYFFNCTIKVEAHTSFTVEVKADNLALAREKLDDYLMDRESEASNTNSPIWEDMTIDSTDYSEELLEPSDVTRYMGRKIQIGD